MAERRLLLLGGTVVLLAALFALWGLRAPYGFILSLRLTKLASLAVVGASIGAATVLFQTVSANRLLTPGIVGFDALYVFIQTALVLSLGGVGYAGLPAMAQFLTEAGLLVLAGVVLFGVILRRGAEDVLRMILTGVILGVLLRGLSSFAQRLLDPSDFAIVQQASFATFGAVDQTQLAIAAALLVAAFGMALRIAPALDVAGLGRTTARSLGVDHDRLVLTSLSLVALLVAISTALVGPITFLGLLAASLAHSLAATHRHVILIPAAALIGAAILIAGQFVFERLLGLQSTLAVVVEFAGGLLFLILLLRKPRR
ncbi:enterobactin ABC transporter permease [Salipiger sp. IMCC34102]|uniref:iron chelate uptake ABC transporter family permease subunit n=1 Tax=Salipiger sp. IMCC34102 TaxID=2510647 RepID=UPI00101BC61F|nr:iron chelate uptake ABC transporter family permease subunit [Salipiger sp. IMCC34102]RYH02610.1 enterobactin ABC transporter permease [Salipiger sp. IMCC34102]